MTDITTEETSRDWFNHTKKLLIKSLSDVMLSLENSVNNLFLISKWGFDNQNINNALRIRQLPESSTVCCPSVKTLFPQKEVNISS